MDTPDYPPNSESSKGREKNIERVTSGEVTRKKKSLRKQFQEVFIAGTMKSAATYVAFEVLLPELREMISNIVSQGTDKLLWGEKGRRRTGSTTPSSGPTGYVSYNRPPWAAAPQRALSRQARARHNFDEIILSSRVEAEEVIDRLYDVVNRYESASVADLYELVGLSSTHTDNKWGWSSIRGAGVTRVRDGYLLDLPDPEPLD